MGITGIAQFVFWISLLGLFYIYVGYPLLVVILARTSSKPIHTSPGNTPFSIVLVAHNEESCLAAKVESILKAQRSDLIEEVVIASDGSTDGTCAVVEGMRDERIRLKAFELRRGKAAVLNDIVPAISSDIVVLMDARQRVDTRAFVELLKNFGDPSIGVVSGELVFEDVESAAAKGVHAYWSYEKSIRKAESASGSVPGATGAFYGFRKSLFKPLFESSILDDVVIPLSIVQQGYRCVFEDKAYVFDRPSASTEDEMTRKRRTIAGNAQILKLYPSWIAPWGNPLWFRFVSHKLSRLSSPFLLLSLLISNVLLLKSFFLFGLLVQVAFYALALGGWVCKRAKRKLSFFSAPLMFVVLNVVTVYALWDAVRGRYHVKWTRV